MTDRLKTRALRLFGFAVILSGGIRYLSRADGDKGLWFGLVMGVVALAGSILLGRGQRALGLAFGWTALFFVGGWFVYEALIHKGFAVAENRQLVILGLTAITTVIVAIPRSTAGAETHAA